MEFAKKRIYLKTNRESPFKACEASISSNLRNTIKKNFKLNTWEVKKFLATPNQKRKNSQKKNFRDARTVREIEQSWPKRNMNEMLRLMKETDLPKYRFKKINKILSQNFPQT